MKKLLKIIFNINKKFDELKEPKRFFVFFIPMVIIFTLAHYYPLKVYPLIGVIIILRILYVERILNKIIEK